MDKERSIWEKAICKNYKNIEGNICKKYNEECNEEILHFWRI